MRRLIVTEFMSLDGVVEAPGGERSHRHGGWTFPYATDALEAAKLQEIREADSLLLGRHTYEQFAEAWPPREGAFADRMNSLPKTVVASGREPLDWNASRLDTAASGTVRSAVAALKEGDGGPILVAGSATLVRSLVVWGLVDELRLLIYPVLLGGGRRIFPDDREKWTFELAELDRYDSGAVLHVYRLAGS
ncbi:MULTISPECIES: dihydrofolate reductase family protein [unclassified Leifsonia]|uniref:dihydrofolate reductase family protein n=1 Tax=unclassified Leifsonia TaxID=2663824 RepID=UPI00092A7A53|nr:dihydrofolate reductase family protein [Leifsonia sp. 71-9]OJX73140.1 MAG: pyrimidine reductase [Leifsonia sp. 71-9]